MRWTDDGGFCLVRGMFLCLSALLVFNGFSCIRERVERLFGFSCRRSRIREGQVRLGIACRRPNNRAQFGLALYKDI